MYVFVGGRCGSFWSQDWIQVHSRISRCRLNSSCTKCGMQLSGFSFLTGEQMKIHLLRERLSECEVNCYPERAFPFPHQQHAQSFYKTFQEISTMGSCGCVIKTKHRNHFAIYELVTRQLSVKKLARQLGLSPFVRTLLFGKRNPPHQSKTEMTFAPFFPSFRIDRGIPTSEK